MDAFVDTFVVAARFAHVVCVALLGGIALFPLYAGADAAKGAGSLRDDIGVWLRRVLLMALAGALVSALAWLCGVAASMGEGWSSALDPDTLAGVLTDTRFGRVWIGRLALMAVLGTVLARAPAPGSRLQEATMALVAAAVVTSLSLTGHAAAHTGAAGMVQQAADAVHLLCAATWLGGLLALAYLLGRARREPRWRAHARLALPRFSRIGYAAVGLIGLTGCLNAAAMLSGPAALTGTVYGRVLLGKVTLFALMLALAGVNRGILAPHLAPYSATAEGGASAQIAAHLRLSICLELALGLGVLALVAVLGTLHPAY